MPQDRPNPAEFGAIGYKDEMPAADLAGKHVDGVTGLVFETMEAYESHTSPVSGHKPTEIEHLVKTTQPEAQAIADAAIARGEERREETQHPAEVTAEQTGKPVDAPADSAPAA